MVSVSVLCDQNEQSDIACLLLKEDDLLISTVKVKTAKDYIEILSIDWYNDSYKLNMIKFLIKSIANFAINRNKFVLVCYEEKIFDDLICIGFKKDENNVNMNVFNLMGTCKK